MQVKWEKRKVLVPTCPVCKVQLGGDNSFMSPYYCECGVWKSSFRTPNEYEIVKGEAE